MTVSHEQRSTRIASARKNAHETLEKIERKMAYLRANEGPAAALNPVYVRLAENRAQIRTGLRRLVWQQLVYRVKVAAHFALHVLFPFRGVSK